MIQSEDGEKDEKNRNSAENSLENSPQKSEGELSSEMIKNIKYLGQSDKSSDESSSVVDLFDPNLIDYLHQSSSRISVCF